jgi:4-hydroxybenzoyl-CoA thioesterase
MRTSTESVPIPFVQERRVPWGDADPAGTLYFAHVARYCMEAIEQWFVEVLDIDWARINTERKIGTPMVRAEIDFKNAAAAGEVVAVRVTVEKLGRSSLVFGVHGDSAQASRSCWAGRFTCVFIDTATRQSIPIPDDYRSAVSRYIKAVSQAGISALSPEDGPASGSRPD